MHLVANISCQFCKLRIDLLLGSTITFSTPTIEGTILRRNKADAGGKHPWKAEALEGDVTAATITNWYKEVYEPTYTTTPEKQG